MRSDLGYRGPVKVSYRGEIPDIHFSNRFLQDRRFLFHVCHAELTDADLHQPGSILERALVRRGKDFLWLPGSRLSDPSIRFSPTMSALRVAVVNLIPPQLIPAPM